MDNTPIADPVIAPPPPPVVADRRRPGRVNYAQSALIELLRQKPGGATVEEADPTSVEADATDETSDGLAPARGILVGILLSVPIWCLSAAGLWFWLRH
jgi:hypothetical protein